MHLFRFALLVPLPLIFCGQLAMAQESNPPMVKPPVIYPSPDSYLDAVRAQRQALMEQHMRGAQEVADARRDAVQEKLDQRRKAFDELAGQHREQMDRMRRERMRQHYYPYIQDYYGWGNPWGYFDNPAASAAP